MTNVTHVPRAYLFLILVLLFPLQAVSQTGSYTVTKAPFSSDVYDEFSPVYYNNGIVFTSNNSSSGMTSYSDSRNKSPFSLYYIDTTFRVRWRNAILFSKDIESKLNDGPATFSSNGDTMYFSRNQNVDLKVGRVLGTRNKLGVFCSVRTGGKWNNLKEFRFNIEWYNVTTPFLSPDGKKLYFSSDQPGGMGGMDLYCSQWRNGYWDTPVNLGPVVNTTGNESYPFINKSGELFFASDGHKGLGGKDIFVTKQKESGWYTPVRLDEPVNSEFDDFGFISDPLVNEGYFSSKREETVDIYQFRSHKFQFWFSEVQKDDKFCFSVEETGAIAVDSTRFGYIWNFGDGTKVSGRNVSHCFPGAGKYNVNLDIIDIRTGKTFFRKLSYDVVVSEICQPFINAPDYITAYEVVEFDGLKSNNPGYTPVAYYWDFGDGSQGVGEKVSHIYSRGGPVEVRMGMTLRSQQTGEIVKKVISKKIMVVSNAQEKARYLNGPSISDRNILDISLVENFRVVPLFSAEADFLKESVFQVVLQTSQTQVPLTTFSKVPAKYTVREQHDGSSGTYNYIIDEQIELMDVYPTFHEIVTSGFPDARVRLKVLENGAEKQLYGIRMKYEMLTDNYFATGNKLLTNAILMLNSVVSMMNDHPDVKLEIGVHSDNQGEQGSIQWQTQSRAQAMVDYLVSSGISVMRLRAKGYGSTRPVASNSNPTDRKLNRRVEVTIFR